MLSLLSVESRQTRRQTMILADSSHVERSKYSRAALRSCNQIFIASYLKKFKGSAAAVARHVVPFQVLMLLWFLLRTVLRNISCPSWIQTAIMESAKKQTKPPPAWRFSEAKKILLNDIISQEVPDDMDAWDVYFSREIYWLWPFDNFKTNIKNLRAAVARDIQRARADHAALLHDLKKNPLPETVVTGSGTYPRWNGSEAERLLKLDIDEGWHLIMTPSDLQSTKEEYKEYPLRVFAKHIHQEWVGRLERSYWQAKKKEKHAGKEEREAALRPAAMPHFKPAKKKSNSKK